MSWFKAAGTKYNALLLLTAFCPALSQACVLCPSQGQPLSKEISTAKLVVFGSIVSAKPDPDGIQGTSEFKVEAMIQGEKSLVRGGMLTLPRYVPPTPGVKYLLFLDVTQGQLDPYRNIVCSSDRMVEYLTKMPSLSGNELSAQRQARLLYTFGYLRDKEPEIAADAYKEWSVSSNRDVAQVAERLNPALLRKWLLDPKTPAHCLSLFAYLLGSCGTDDDMQLLKRLVQHPSDQRMAGALDGLLSGLSRRQPKEAWREILRIISSAEHTFSDRHAMLRLLRFLHDTEGDKAKKEILQCAKSMLAQGDVSDLMIEQLRQWKMWEHTDSVIQEYQRATAPITKRAILRYALSCPLPIAEIFVRQVRQTDPELLRDVVDAVQLENGK